MMDGFLLSQLNCSFLSAFSVNTLQKMDSYTVLKAPLTTESAMKKIEDNNTLGRVHAKLSSLLLG